MLRFKWVVNPGVLGEAVCAPLNPSPHFSWYFYAVKNTARVPSVSGQNMKGQRFEQMGVRRDSLWMLIGYLRYEHVVYQLA